MTHSYFKGAKTWRSQSGLISATAILAAAGICDGWTIFEPRAFTEKGIPADLVETVTYEHTSDTSDPKGTIYDTKSGRVRPKLKGVYGLDLLRAMANGLDIKYASKMGRGFQAQAIQEALRNALQPKNQPVEG